MKIDFVYIYCMNKNTKLLFDELINYDYCKCCSQGKHKAVHLTDILHHNHGRNDDIDE